MRGPIESIMSSSLKAAHGFTEAASASRVYLALMRMASGVNGAFLAFRDSPSVILTRRVTRAE
jgi:hypothetical protein